MSGPGKYLGNLLESLAEAETEDLEIVHGEFTARIGKWEKITFSVAAVLSIALGVPVSLLESADIGLIFLILGGCMLLLLPAILSYRCVVNKTFLQEEYWLLFIKITKHILWDNICYRKQTVGKRLTLVLYDERKKRLISFDNSIVGYRRIVKLAKRSSIRDIHPNNPAV